MILEKNDIRERIKHTFIEVLNIEFVEDENSKQLVCLMKVTQELSQTMGVLHGGATIALAETVAGVGSNSQCQPNEKCFGMQISASHISSAHIGDTVRAIGKVVHWGRTTHVWDVEIYSETTKKLVSTIRVTNAVVKDR